ncbi:Hpt domain-containing protein [Archangium lipolyticum]|uniref:Hpt domain-containing protein n=1 Tax=Archangium lipolyticum TaxID=2970465 RepID=UPI00214A18FB|nr:Hpt domain-containing protein [Archangium lipolyticum]
MTSMEQSAPVFDAKQLDKLRVLEDEKDPHVVVDLARGFLSRSPERMDQMRKLLAAGDAARLANESHGMASSSGMFGMMRVRQLCKALENLVREQGLAGAGEMLDEVEREFTRARPLLVAELGLQD